jgi:quercetin dioxygenase-like cupin family protein
MSVQEKPAWEQVAAGMQRRIIVDGDKLMVVEVHFTPGGGAARHNHPHEQVTYVLNGSIRFTLDGKETVLKAGECVHIPSNVYHSAAADEEVFLLDVFSPPREDFRPKA